MKRWSMLSVLLVLVLLALSACNTAAPAPQPAAPQGDAMEGKGGDAMVKEEPAAPAVPSASGGVSGPQTHRVAISGFKFVPAQLDVKVGDTVEWVNEDSAPHTATADSGEFDSDRLVTGDSFSFTFGNKGDFSYLCEIHPSMKGSVSVE